MVQGKKRKSEKPEKRKSSGTMTYIMRNRRYKVTMKLIKEMEHLQNTTHNCIPKLSFSRLCREIMRQYTPPDYRCQYQALQCLQEASEMYLTQLFEQANMCAHHAKRITLMPIDMRLTLALRGISDPGQVLP